MISAFSYQVPKEVGKVGTESPTFIQPVAERKDGIQAMFAKQARAAHVQGSPSKRKLEDSYEEKEIKREKEHPTKKVNTWEDDDEIEYIGSTAPRTEIESRVCFFILLRNGPSSSSCTVLESHSQPRTPEKVNHLDVLFLEYQSDHDCSLGSLLPGRQRRPRYDDS